MNLLNDAKDSKFVTKNRSIVNDQSNANYDVGNEIIFNTKVLKFDILGRGNTTVTGLTATQIVFKKCAPFTKCITKTDGTIIDDAEDLDLVVSMYNLIEYCLNYSDTLLCSFRLVLEGKTGKEMPESSRSEFLEKFLANTFTLSEAEDNTSGSLNRRGIADLPLFRTLLAICQKS